MSNLQITTLDQLKDMFQIVDLGEFDNGVPLIAKVKKPNLMSLVAHGKIPNPLMTAAMDMFNGNKDSMDNLTKDAKSLTNFFGLMEIMAQDCLIEPSYEELQSVGVELSQDQMLSILMYAQGGVKALEGFRQKSGSSESAEFIPDVQ